MMLLALPAIEVRHPRQQHLERRQTDPYFGPDGQVNPVSVKSLGLVSLLLPSIGVLAAHLPARRAARTDPAECLRSE